MCVVCSPDALKDMKEMSDRMQAADRRFAADEKRKNSGTVSIFSLSESLGIDPNALVDACQTAGTSESLRHLADVETAAEKLREYAVSRLRADSRTWAYIGVRLGMTPQAAHKRFRHLVN